MRNRSAHAQQQRRKTGRRQESLVAVTARSNRSKADQDPAQWLPPAADVHCRYLAEWVGTKLRWALAVDDAEQATLESAASACPDQTVTYEPVS